jgi:uncharacterized membrane protein YdjX (TVP38/TMEM64 family)
VHRFRLFALVALVASAFAAAAILLPHSPQQLRETVLAAGIAAPAVALLAWAVLTPALVSGTLLAAAGGLAFGTAGGAALSVGGALLGGLAAFGLARSVAREQAEAMLARPKLAKLRDLLDRRGFQAVLAARLMPGVPATALHYAAGASPVRARSFAAAIAIGALLRTTPYALLGVGLGSGSLVAVLVAVASIAVGGLTATLLLRQLRRPAAIPA